MTQPPHDELDDRTRTLDAERARPDVKPQTTQELMRRLIHTLHQLYLTPPDRNHQGGA